MPTFNRQSSRLLEDLFQKKKKNNNNNNKTINKTKNMANINHYHGDEMRHM